MKHLKKLGFIAPRALIKTRNFITVVIYTGIFMLFHYYDYLNGEFSINYFNRCYFIK